MPYFRWEGVNSEGEIKRGFLFARTVQDLDALLFQERVALVRAREQRIKRRLIYGAISLQERAHFMRRIAMLLKSGILLPQALLLVSNQLTHRAFKSSMLVATDRVWSGQSFADALAQERGWSLLIVQLIRAGQEANNLAKACEAVASHLENTDAFYRAMRSALFLPLLTFCFFGALLIGVVVGIIPYFGTVFASLGKPVPPLTAHMIAISEVARSWYALAALGAMSGIALCVYVWSKTATGKRMLAEALWRLPLVGFVLRQCSALYFLHSLGLLLEQKVGLVEALRIMAQPGNEIAHYAAKLSQTVESGIPLSDVMGYHASHLFSEDVLAMVRTGEQADNLDEVIDLVVKERRTELLERLKRLASLVQPLSMVLLGLCALFLIFAVYMPIFNLASSL